MEDTSFDFFFQNRYKLTKNHELRVAQYLLAHLNEHSSHDAFDPAVLTHHPAESASASKARLGRLVKAGELLRDRIASRAWGGKNIPSPDSADEQHHISALRTVVNEAIMLASDVQPDRVPAIMALLSVHVHNASADASAGLSSATDSADGGRDAAAIQDGRRKQTTPSKPVKETYKTALATDMGESLTGRIADVETAVSSMDNRLIDIQKALQPEQFSALVRRALSDHDIIARVVDECISARQPSSAMELHTETLAKLREEFSEYRRFNKELHSKASQGLQGLKSREDDKRAALEARIKALEQERRRSPPRQPTPSRSPSVHADDDPYGAFNLDSDAGDDSEGPEEGEVPPRTGGGRDRTGNNRPPGSRVGKHGDAGDRQPALSAMGHKGSGGGNNGGKGGGKGAGQQQQDGKFCKACNKITDHRFGDESCPKSRAILSEYFSSRRQGGGDQPHGGTNPKGGRPPAKKPKRDGNNKM